MGSPIDLGQIINLLLVIRERWLWGLSVAVLAAGVFAFVMLRKEAVYESSATLLIEAKAAQVIDVEQVVDTSLSGQGEAELENHLRQLQSRSFRNDVVDSFNEQEVRRITRAYEPEDPEVPAPKPGGIVARSVSVGRDGQVFTIRARHRTPEAAQLIANRYAAQYITNILTRTGVGNQSAQAFLQRQVEDLRKEISKTEKSLTDYRSKYNLVSLEENQNIIVQELKAINEELTTARMEQLKLQSQVRQVERAREKERDLTELEAVAAYGSIPAILARKKELESRRAELSLRYLERHPRIIEVVRQLEQVNSQLDRETERAVRALRNRKDSVDDRIARLREEMEQAEAQALNLDKRAVEYNVLKRQLESDRRTFDTIVQRLNETNLSAKLDTTNLRILDEAVVPGVPVEPDPKKIVLGSAFLFVLGFGGLPLLIEALDNRLKSAYDVESFVGKPLLADLPYVKELDTEEQSPVAVLHGSQEVLSEGFRSAYSGMQMNARADFPKTFLVTSTRPEEGKSFIASNLVACLAQHGLRCLLVDADLRRPTLHRHFNLRNDKGLLTWFEALWAGKVDFNGLEVATDPFLSIQEVAPGFHFLRAGGSTKKTTEIYDSDSFARLHQALRAQYDVILFDTPPLAIFTDALFLSDYAEEVVYVARFNQVSRQKARHFIQRLDGPHNKVIGLVINGRTSSKGQRYGYDYAYSYYSSDYKYYKRYARDHEDAPPRRRDKSRRSRALPS